MTSVQLPTPDALLDPTTGKMSPAWYAALRTVAKSVNQANAALGITNEAVQQGQTTLAGQLAAAQSSLTDQLSSTATTLTGQIDDTNAALETATTSLADQIAAVDAAVGGLVIPSLAQAHGEHVFIEYADDKTYVIVQSSEVAWVIENVTTQAGTGTCTLTVYIGGTPLGGSANSVSTSETTQPHASANEVAVGDTVSIVISSNASCESVGVSIVGTKLLDT